MKIPMELKDWVMIFGIIAAIVGAANAQKENTITIKNMQQQISEVKKEVVEKRKVDLEQTVLLKSVTVELKNLAHITERLEKKLEK